jgi:hypothetical protein
MATGIALILAQYFVTALHLWGSHCGMSLHMPMLPLFASATADTWGAWGARVLLRVLLSAFPVLWDLGSMCGLLFSSFTSLATVLSELIARKPRRRAEILVQAAAAVQTELGNVMPSLKWTIWYARRRLSIAGLLQALPQTFFHCYMLLYCYHTWKQCEGHQPPKAALLGVAIGLDVALVVVAAPGIGEVWLLVKDWLNWDTWGSLVREVVDSGLYIADIGFDVFFVIVSTTPPSAGSVKQDLCARAASSWAMPSKPALFAIIWWSACKDVLYFTPIAPYLHCVWSVFPSPRCQLPGSF